MLMVMVKKVLGLTNILLIFMRVLQSLHKPKSMLRKLLKKLVVIRLQLPHISSSRSYMMMVIAHKNVSTFFVSHSIHTLQQSHL